MNLLNDDIQRLFFKFLIPSICGTIVVALYGFVDTIAMGQSAGPNGSAANAVIVPIFSMANFLGILCGIGTSVLMSRAKGAGKTEKANAYYTASLFFTGVIVTAVWVLLLLFRDPVYRILGASDILLPYVKDYGDLTIAVFPLYALLPYLSCMLRNDNNPGLVMTATLAGAVINIFGDWYFVFPLGMGIFGAALATALGAFVQVIIMASHFFTKKCTMKLERPHRIIPAVRNICINGFGASFSLLAMIVTTFIINNQIMRYAGEPELAVYGVLIVLSSLFSNIFTGIGQAVQPIASTNYGAGQTERCSRVYRLGLITAIICSALFTLLCISFPVEINMIFMKVTPEIVAAAGEVTFIYSLSFIPMAAAVYFTLYFQSVMKATAATVISVMRGIAASGVFLLVLPAIFGGDGIWWAVVCAESVTAISAMLYMFISSRRQKTKTNMHKSV